ncbi:hypothetical protein DLAC_01846 [Tieghemostelium lacteum]|uniref:Ras-GAP domain-containing protein n=1 Tax=Tieghemostelium lacteum TaxID=361077 RepID=A0A152A6G6_TIELA|nr:hypothetical protein DLAC_01846 [Tieghemostelium lacteum]|eukprot:KYR01829.1 hypothetical protein DLAC_01846 [Tieghemostelium lacteum]
MSTIDYEDKLIGDLIGRINVQIKLNKNVGGYQTQDQIQQDQIRKYNEDTLIKLSSTKLQTIANGLSESLENLMKRKDKDETPEHNLWAQSYVLKLLSNCMSNQWQHIKSQFRNVQGLDEKEAIRLKEKEEQILPPPLEESSAKTLLDRCMNCLMRSVVNNEVELQINSGNVLFQLSATNYEAVSGKILDIFHSIASGKETDEQTNQFMLIEHLNLNSKRLSELLDKVTKSAANIKKDKQQLIFSQVLRKAVWNWIDNYPMEFVALCQSGERLPGNPDGLFDILDGWAKKTTHKNSFWPLQTMLLILCPDIMLKIYKDKSDVYASKEKFLDNLKKSLKIPKLADVAAICYVDICKASTFVSKSDMSALRYIVPAIETELKERLFNVTRQPEANNELDLMTDCLVSSFRIQPRKITTLIPDCLSPEVPQHFRMVYVRSLLRIAQDLNTLPWNPTIVDAYSFVAGPLRSLFQDCLSSVRNYNLLKNATDKKSKTQFEKVTHDTQVMGYLIQLFNADPNLPLHSVKTAAQDLEEIRTIITGLCFCASQFQIPEISDVAAETLLKFHKPLHIESWFAKGQVSGFWEISSAVNVSLANTLIEQKDIKAEQIQKLVTLLEEILLRRNEFLDKYKETLRPEQSVRDARSQGSTKLEVALLIHLCSSEPDICSKCATCFGLLCEEIEILGEMDEVNGIVSNYPVYKKLSTAGVLQTGRQHQQKVIRTLLRRIEVQTTGNFAAWEDVYSRWNSLTPVLLLNDDAERNKKPQSSSSATAVKVDKSPAEVKQEWHNTLGFLCGLSAITFNKETTVRVNLQQSQERLLRPGLLNKKNVQTEKTVKVIDSFMDELMDLVVSDNAFIRETAMSLIGTGLSPASYSCLFRHLQAEIQSFFGEAGQLEVNDRSTLFVDQSISIVKHILDISHEADDLSMVTTFEGLMTLIIKYINYLVQSTTSLKIKKNFCTLLEMMMVKRQYISFSKEMDFRNQLVENIIEWTSDFNMKSSLSLSTDNPSRIDVQTQEGSKSELILLKKLIKEVDVACITTIASLLRGLVLTTDVDTQSNKFGKYFTFFTTLLTRCKQDGESPPQLAENAIKCLSNMLNANIHSGLEYVVTMGYHEDHETRSAFLRVIANILNQGTGFDVVEDDQSADRYEKFIELLLEPDYSCILALGEITQITEADEVAKVLVNFSEANDKTMSVLKSVIQHEVTNTDTANTIFRRNSVATKMLATYTKLIGTPYLKSTLLPVIKTLLNNTNSMEIDPGKITPGVDDIQANTNALIKLTKQFIQAIQDSVPNLPAPFREISNYIAKVVQESFPGNEKMAIGGIMFLRFICPAIVSPESFGIVGAGALSRETRRALVLSTKILQNLANGQMGVRESYMANLNAFVNENVKVIDDLFDSFTVMTTDHQVPFQKTNITDEQKDEDIIVLHQHFAFSLEKITKQLIQMNQKEPSDRLISILQRLGPPPDLQETKKKGTLVGRSTQQNAKTSSNFYEDFMRRFANLNTDAIKQKKIFYKHGVTKEKHPVFYYIARRFESNIDMEHLLYHILKTVQDSIRSPFVLVLDCTLFTVNQQIPLPWCTTWLRHFPDLAAENLKHIYIVNPNHAFKKYSKRITKLIGRAAKKITFLANPLKFYDIVSESESGLPSTSMAVETDVKSTFSPVFKLSGQYNEKNVTLRISSEVLQLVSIGVHNVFGKQTTLTDLYHISTLLEVSRSAVDEDQEFIVKYEQSGIKTMTLRSPSVQQIIQAINQLKARWKLSKPDQTKISNRVFRPQDIPGTLLNVALLNLGSTRNALRVAAYNMLSALCRNSNFALKLQLLETNGLCIPKNSTQFVIRVSEKLAKTEKPLTLEFLSECLHGITKASAVAKYLVLDYISPWIPNLADFCQKSCLNEEKYQKTITVLNSLIDLSLHEVSMKSLILSKVWETLGRQKPELVNLALKCCLKKCLEVGFGTNTCETVGEMISSMAAESPQLISGKIISKLLTLLEKTGLEPSVHDLSENKLWPQIIVYERLLLLLSFDNLIYSQQYLPELLHIICTLFSSGNVNVRITTHGLLINTCHSLYTTLVSNENKLQGLPFMLSEFGQPSFKLLFGIGGASLNTDFTTPDPTSKELEKMAITNMDPVVSSILQVLNICSPNNQAMGTQWHSRWLSFTTIAALKPNPPIQARALMTLGITARSTNFISDELFFNILSVLKSAVSSPRSLQDHNDLIVGVLSCFTKLFEYLPHTSKYTIPLFWVATTCVQLYEPRIFTAAITLLEVILKVVDRADLFKESVSKTYMQTYASFGKVLSGLDLITGISFESNFSFAIAAHLLKGLRYPSTKTATVRLMTTFLTITAKRSSGSSILGYLTALFTTEGEIANLDQITSTDSAKTPLQVLYSKDMLPDVDHACLLFTFLVTILVHTDREHEQLFIYEALKEGIQFMPQAFPVIYKSFIPKLSNVITSSQIGKMMQSSLSIMEFMFSIDKIILNNQSLSNSSASSLSVNGASTGTNRSPPTSSTNNTYNVSHLKSMGFHGLSDCGSGFNRPNSQTINDAILKTLLEVLKQISTLPDNNKK